ncbi:Kinase [Hexamita inflata]|uniref:Kinase n=1 Tax=Hexamita inflata TaxID=28002 RepID=A0ABP1H7I8_9EUKA
MADPLNNYQNQKLLGERAYVIVYKARNIRTGQNVALKQIKYVDDNDLPTMAIREIAILKSLRHQNIVDLIAVIQTFQDLKLVFEQVDLDLKKYMDKYGRLTPLQVKFLMCLLLEGLAYKWKRFIPENDENGP